ncbi:hypothetical protein SCAR479_11600 [Seiridium cardinale]|uniref:Uncharacterized protein n=1 Tax=Seiridium cardinale TaxID=138064 RepID=A0ABR2XDK3_9PEZI
MLGGVETTGNDPANKNDLELPVGSYYQKIWSTINRYKKALVYPNKQNVDVAAKNIVNDVLSGPPIFIRRGNSSTLSWCWNTFLPYSLFVNMINKESGLSDL